jgi:hypothetical protein
MTEHDYINRLTDNRLCTWAATEGRVSRDKGRAFLRVHKTSGGQGWPDRLSELVSDHGRNSGGSWLVAGAANDASGLSFSDAVCRSFSSLRGARTSNMIYVISTLCLCNITKRTAGQ